MTCAAITREHVTRPPSSPWPSLVNLVRDVAGARHRRRRSEYLPNAGYVFSLLFVLASIQPDGALDNQVHMGR